MRKVRIEYDSRVDALVAVSKRLSVYEGRNKMESEYFFDRFVKGQTEDSEEFVEWANDYQHYLALRQEVEAKIRHVGYIERYEEERLTPERVNVRIRVRFPKGWMLEWNEAVIVEQGHLAHLAYRYHFQDKQNRIIFRYDNTLHFSGMTTFPKHKHSPGDVIPANRPSVFEVLDEVKGTLRF
jgi:hypothetical protein